MKKIVLIEPKSTHIHVYSAIPIPRLGLVLMGTMLRDRGYEVKIYIEEITKVSVRDVLEADLVGISVISSTAPKSYEWAEKIRNAGIPVVLGGQHVSYLTDEALDYADFVVRGEGEDTFMELIAALEGDGDFSKIIGLSYHEGGRKVHNPDRPLPTDLDRFPIPDFSLVQGKKKFFVIPMMTARGCPFGCSFCSVTNFNGRRYRTMSVKRTLEHIEYYWKHHPVRYFFFADDIFNLQLDRAKAIVRGMIDLGVKCKWGAQVRHEIVRDEEMLELMHQANCDRVFIGFESINPKTLEAYGKKETVEEVENAMRAFHRHKIKVHGMFVLGSDEDTVETVDSTLHFARRHDIDSIQFLILTPIPGSKDYESFASGERKLLSRNWSHYDGHHCVYEPKQMTPFELQSETMRTMKQFYNARAILQRVIRRDWYEVGMRMIGWHLTRRWARNHDHYVLRLHKDLLDGVRKLLPGLSLRGKKRVAIADAVGSVTSRQVLETFLRELGVKVVQSKSLVGGYVTQGKEAVLKEKEALGKAISEFLEEVKGKADCVLLPIVEHQGEEEAPDAAINGVLAKIKTQWASCVSVIKFSPDFHSAEFRRRLTQLGLAFTRDFDAIRRATAKALEIVPQGA